MHDRLANGERNYASLLSIIFLTCLLDVVSLTIAIPILPFLLGFYLESAEGVDPTGLQWALVKLLELTGAEAGGPQAALIASGVLALIFSFAQFVATPIWGRLSDSFGRKRILLCTVAGAFLAQCLWFFGASLELFILVRLVGGSMAGNISVATAAIADAVPGKKRARAMTVIGLSYGIGYMIGPLVGGATAKLDLLQLFPDAASWGIHPFSFTAGIAGLLTILNLILLKYAFSETLPASGRNQSVRLGFTLFASLFAKVPDRNTRKLFLANFFFFAAFISCEFNIVFLALERFQFSAVQNALMYSIIGLTQIVAQVVALPIILRWANEKAIAIMGFALLALGIMWCAVCSSGLQLYLACGAMSFGSSLVFPCLTSLVSRRSSSVEQGQMLGIFRSRGDLGTAFGPLLQSLVYFQMGSFWAFSLCSVILLVPILLVSKISLKTASSQ